MPLYKLLNTQMSDLIGNRDSRLSRHPYVQYIPLTLVNDYCNMWGRFGKFRINVGGSGKKPNKPIFAAARPQTPTYRPSPTQRGFLNTYLSMLTNVRSEFLLIQFVIQLFSSGANTLLIDIKLDLAFRIWSFLSILKILLSHTNVWSSIRALLTCLLL